MMKSPASNTAFLSDPKFWAEHSGFFCNRKLLLEFADVIGVSHEYIQAKRREGLRHFLINQCSHFCAGNGTIN